MGALLLLTKDKDARVRLGAIQVALGHGWGRPAQGVELEVAVQVTALEQKIIAPLVIEHSGGGGREVRGPNPV